MLFSKTPILFEKHPLDRTLIFILILAFFIRLIFMWVYPDQNFPDAIAYKTIGQEIFAGEIITNNTYMPLYPILTYLTGGGTTQILMDIIISTISIWLIFLISFELFNNRLASIFSALIAALYPHFIFYSLSGLTETFFTFLLLLSFLLFYRKKVFWACIITALSVLVKPTFDYLNPALIILFVGLVYNSGWRSVIKYLGVYVLVYIVIMSSWWIHQNHKYGEFVRLNLGDGIVLYSGNNELNRSGGGITGIDVEFSEFSNEKNPVIRNQKMKDSAFNYIINNPSRFVELAGVKFLRFWRLWPYASDYVKWYIVAASILSYGFVLVLSLGFVLRGSRKHFTKLLPIFALFGYLTAVHMITIGSIRYRFPLEPFLIIFASQFLISLLQNKSWFVNVSKKYLE